MPSEKNIIFLIIFLVTLISTKVLAQNTITIEFDKDGRILTSNNNGITNPSKILFIVRDTQNSPYKLSTKQFDKYGLKVNSSISFIQSGTISMAELSPIPSAIRLEYVLIKQNTLEENTEALTEYSKLIFEQLEILKQSRRNLQDTIMSLESAQASLIYVQNELKKPVSKNRKNQLTQQKVILEREIIRLGNDSSKLDKVMCAGTDMVLRNYNAAETVFRKILQHSNFKKLLNSDTLLKVKELHDKARKSSSPNAFISQQIEIYKALVADIKTKTGKTTFKIDSISSSYAEAVYNLAIAELLLNVYKTPLQRDTLLYIGSLYFVEKQTQLLTYNAYLQPWEQEVNEKLVNKNFFYEVQNLRKKDTFAVKVKKLADSTATTIALTPIVDALSFTSLKALTSIPSFDFYEDFNKVYNKGGINNIFDGTICSRRFDTASAIIENDLLYIALFNSFKPTFISDTIPNYYSLTAYFPDTFETSTRTTLTLKNKSVPFSYNYEHHKKYKIWAAAGLTYIFGDVSEISYEDGKGLSATNVSGMHPSVGIKYYPVGTAPLNNKPDLNFHFYAGLDFLRPLKSYQIGLGFDLISGFAIGTGFNLFLLQQPIMVENKLDRTYTYLYRSEVTQLPPAYINISIDPSLFIKVFTSK